MNTTRYYLELIKLTVITEILNKVFDHRKGSQENFLSLATATSL